MSREIGIITGKLPQIPIFKTLAVIGAAIFLIQMDPISKDAHYRVKCIQKSMTGRAKAPDHGEIMHLKSATKVCNGLGEAQ